MSELLISAIIEFRAVPIGILQAFWIERIREKRKYEHRLEEILPTIFYEITDNNKLLKELIDDQRFF